MKSSKIILLALVLFVGSDTNSFAQQKKNKKTVVKKIQRPPQIKKGEEPPILKSGSNGQTYAEMPDVTTTKFMPVETVGVRQAIAIEPAQDSVRPARKKKVYNKPFQFWPSVDTVMKEDYNVYLAKKKALLKNFSTAKAPDYKEPAIKSVYELCYQLSADGKNHGRYYGDGWTNKIEYDANGNMSTLYVIFEDDNSKKDSAYLTTKYFYVEDKLTLKEFYWWASGRKEAETEIDYDANGRPWKEYYTPFDTNGKEIIEEGRGYKILYNYKKNSIVEEHYERLDDAMKEFVLNKTKTIKLDASGNEISSKSIEWPEDMPYSQYQYRYDAKGNKIFSGDEQEYSSYSYNKNGDMETHVFSSGGYIRSTRYSYKYDKYNNWIERIETTTENKKFIDSYLWKRIIQYYK